MGNPDIEAAATPAPDPVLKAASGIIWLIVLNKPVYPFYVWWITGHGLGPAFLTGLSAPLFLALLPLARRDPLWLLAGLPLIGAVDTAFATKLFGEPSGTAIFFVPCALLLAVLMPPRAYRLTWGLAGLLFLLVVGLHGRYGRPLYAWTPADLSALLSLNIASAAALSAFILVRFARLRA